MRLCKRMVVLLCLLAGGGCGKQKSTDQLIQDLSSSEEKDRIIAVRLLQERDRDAAKVVPALMKALKAKETDVRISAAIGLGYFGDEAKDAIPALQAAQKDRDVRVREAAGVALSRIDPEKFSPPPAPSKKRGKSVFFLPSPKRQRGTTVGSLAYASGSEIPFNAASGSSSRSILASR